ncbi:hypothetical protein Ssi02_37160 [Sinosporangium siamense]|uniref:GIY-YIG domain-containing protein n=2 Tax=Sinosporangium siamense TaxID=1367973 RepID=A0A919RIL4_9ACTN|nr:hypothetical protein Ssi02_37160 [Sinosporangium siamense]
MVYIGEGACLAARVRYYTRRHNTKRKTTQTLFSEEIRTALNEHRKVVVDVATTGTINITGFERRLIMEHVSDRRFAEAAAVMNEWERDKDGLIEIWNRVLDDQKW